VAAHAGAVPEVCAEAALWFDPLRPETLAEAMERLLDEEGLAAGMRQVGLQRAATYTWEKAALALLRFVQENAP
jgi:glycosyltransferase involved in cell wall biosynthesis